jgi:hypothetical protein
MNETEANLLLVNDAAAVDSFIMVTKTDPDDSSSVT